MKKLVNLLFLFLTSYLTIGMLVSSCAEESNCSTAGRPMIRGVVYSYPEKNKNKKDTISWVTVTAMGTDSTIINSQESVNDMLLPLQYAADSTQLILHYDKENLTSDTDTIILWHTNTPYFLSMDCGYEMKQSINKIMHSNNKIDSIYILNPNTKTDGTENLKIFFTL